MKTFAEQNMNNVANPAAVIEIGKGFSLHMPLTGYESVGYPTSRLARGLILCHERRELAEEGLGFDGAGIKTGAFFMLGYPGETDETILKTIRFATSLPLDYLSYTLPYPLPGTALYTRMKDKLTAEWKEGPGLLIDHSLIYKGDFSGPKMKYAIFKAQTEFLLKKKCGLFAPLVLSPFAAASDAVFRKMK